MTEQHIEEPEAIDEGSPEEPIPSDEIEVETSYRGHRKKASPARMSRNYAGERQVSSARREGRQDAQRLHTELVRATGSWPTRQTCCSTRTTSTIPSPQRGDRGSDQL